MHSITKKSTQKILLNVQITHPETVKHLKFGTQPFFQQRKNMQQHITQTICFKQPFLTLPIYWLSETNKVQNINITAKTFKI